MRWMVVEVVGGAVILEKVAHEGPSLYEVATLAARAGPSF